MSIVYRKLFLYSFLKNRISISKIMINLFSFPFPWNTLQLINLRESGDCLLANQEGFFSLVFLGAFVIPFPSLPAPHFINLTRLRVHLLCILLAHFTAIFVFKNAESCILDDFAKLLVPSLKILIFQLDFFY